MLRLYNLLFPVFFVLSAPYYFYRLWRRGNWKKGFAQRFGHYDSKLKQSLTNRHVLWIHAVSVGEVNLCTQLIHALEPKIGNSKIVVSTTTTTGMGELGKKLPAHIDRIYYPVDFSGPVSRSLRLINPEAMILVEAEIWPNFLRKLRRRRIPVFLINARISDRSFRGYQRFSSLFRPLFETFAGVGAQSEGDRERLIQLGVQPEAVMVAGSLKFEGAKLDPIARLDVPGLLNRLGVRPDQPILLGASTHAGEEKMLAEIALRIRKDHPDLFTVIAPRHFERGKEVGKQLEATGIRFAYRSHLGAKDQFEPGALECLLLNTTGELKFFYPYVRMALIGKTLSAAGGQNPIEPAANGCPILFGPRMDNFKEIAAQFLRHDGALQVADASELETAIRNLLKDPEKGRRLAANAKSVIDQNQGAMERTVAMLADRLPKTLLAD